MKFIDNEHKEFWNEKIQNCTKRINLCVKKFNEVRKASDAFILPYKYKGKISIAEIYDGKNLSQNP